VRYPVITFIVTGEKSQIPTLGSVKMPCHILTFMSYTILKITALTKIQDGGLCQVAFRWKQ